MDEQTQEKFKEFWQQFFERRRWHHSELAKLLHVGNDAVSRWVNAGTAISPEHLSQLLKEGVLSPEESTKLVRLCLCNLGFSKGALPSIGSAIGIIPTGKSKLATSTIKFTDFPRLIEAAQGQIDILQTYIPNIEAMKNALSVALIHGCTIRILVLKRNSSYLKARLAHLRGDKSAMETCLVYLKNVSESGRQSKGAIEVRAYDFIPYFPYYRIDNRVFIGFYLRVGSSNYPQIGFGIDELNQVFPDLLQHFDEYWNRTDNDHLYSSHDPDQ